LDEIVREGARRMLWRRSKPRSRRSSPRMPVSGTSAPADVVLQLRSPEGRHNDPHRRGVHVSGSIDGQPKPPDHAALRVGRRPPGMMIAPVPGTHDQSRVHPRRPLRATSRAPNPHPTACRPRDKRPAE
jgi:hypothetical protein